MVSPGLVSHSLAFPPAAVTALARLAAVAASGVATFTKCVGRIGGGAGMSSPSCARARKRAAAPSLRTGVVEIAQKMPFSSIGTMKATAATASRKLVTV